MKKKWMKENGVVETVGATIDGECPACGSVQDSWACKLVCHNCGTMFTCDE